MRTLIRALSLTLTALLALGLFSPRPATAGDGENDFFDKRECICAEGTGACPHFLRSPKKPTEDPCWCNRCREYSKHDGKKVPFGWNPLCFNSDKEQNYLKRHSAAWNITCSECLQNDKSCKFVSENCPDCGPHGDHAPLGSDYRGRDAEKTVMERWTAESRFFRKPKKMRVLYNRYFYLVTDVGPIKVKTPGGSKRLASGHEWAHIMMARAMYARREFEWHFGDVGPLSASLPTAMYIPSKEGAKKRIATQYLGNANSHVLLGGSDKSGVADNFCFHGFVFSEQSTGNDHALHHHMRHMIGHELISTWIKSAPYNRTLPRWMNIGAAHWLGRGQERFIDDATFCGNEGGTVSGSGKDWHIDVSRMAGSHKLDPIEKLFGKTSENQLTLNDHKRAWSYFEICLREWRLPFVKMLRDIRNQRELRDAFMEHMNCTPEIFNERWIARVTGKRRHMSPEFDEDDLEEQESPGARERRSLRREADMLTLAAKVRALGTIDDPKTMELVIDLIDKPSELLRSQIVITMLKAADPEVQEVMWQYGLSHEDAMPRAYTARVCGKLKLEYSQIKLRELLHDKHWYVRA